MRKNCTPGSVRGAARKGGSYRGGTHVTVELLQNQEAGFVDMTFGIDKASREGDYWALELSAVHQGRNVGIRLLVQDGMTPGLVDGNLQQDAVYRKGVYLLPRGHLSDALADIWVQEYGFSGAKAFNPDLGPFTGIVLEGDGRNIEREHVRVKIF